MKGGARLLLAEPGTREHRGPGIDSRACGSITVKLGRVTFVGAYNVVNRRVLPIIRAKDAAKKVSLLAPLDNPFYRCQEY